MTEPPADLRTGAVITGKFEQARALHQQGHLAAAREIYEQILEAEPLHFDTLNSLGVLSGQSGNLEQAVRYFDRAIAAEPGNSAAYCNRGLALKALKQFDAALASFDQAIALNADAVAHYSRADIYKGLGNDDRALAGYDQAIAIDPHFAQAHFNRGILLQSSRQLEAALASYDRAIEIQAGYAEAHANRAFVLYHLNRPEAALAGYDQALAIKPDHAPTHLHRGNVLKALNRFDAALTSYDRAIEIKTDYAEAYANRGLVLHRLERIDDALASFDRAIEINPRYAEAYFNRASLLRMIKRYEAAAADFETAGAVGSGIDFLSGAHLEARMQVCDWRDFDAEVAQIAAGIERDEPAAHPFAVLTFLDSPGLQRKAAETWVRETCRADDSLGPIAMRAPGGKLRIGYFSADFREHPAARLLAELIETHDRSRFDVIGFSFGPDTKDALRKRLAGSFDRFLDVQGQSNREIANLARSLRIDIAVDLAGHTHGSRPDIFGFRAAPLQVNYLGYPGTMGAPGIDYIVADGTLIPPGSEPYFAEKVIYLPNSYQVNDTQRPVANRVFTRDELGLPTSGFVFCCFNNNFKIVPDTFDGWMRILKRVPGSVLWLLEDNASAANNLREHALARGVRPDRLIFARRMALPEHLARQRAADLFLDTLLYNAHTTASDALWVGLPLLTCIGKSFAARVGASLLRAIGLPELIATTQEHYEELAVALATHPGRLAQIKRKLAANRLTTPLFDSRLFTQHLEVAYTKIHARQQAALPPDHLFVGSDQDPG